MASKAVLLQPTSTVLRAAGSRVKPRQARSIVYAVPRMQQQQGEGGEAPVPARRSAAPVSLWEPFGELGFPAIPRMSSLMHEFDTLARAMGMPSAMEPSAAAGQWRALAVDVKDLNDRIEVHADVPGVKNEDVKIAVSPDHVLTLSAERKHETREGSEEEGTLRIERSYGSWRRSFRLPDNTDVEGIKASIKGGELKVTIPKTEVKAREVRQIKVEAVED